MNAVLRAFATRPGRAVLIVLQVLFSTVAITAAVSAYRSAPLPEGGPPERFNVTALTPGASFAVGMPLFEEADVPGLLQLAPAVDAMALYVETGEQRVQVGEDAFDLRASIAAGPDYFRMPEIVVVAGTGFSEADISSGASLAVISQVAADVMFPGRPAVGERFAAQALGGEFLVVGVHQAPESLRIVPAPLIVTPAAAPAGPSATLAVHARSGRAQAAREQVANAIASMFGAVYAGSGVDVSEHLQMDSASTVYLSERSGISLDVVIFGLFGIVAMSVGGIGIFSITVVDLLQRQRELGIERAVGATRLGLAFRTAVGTMIMAALGAAGGVGLAAALLPAARSEAGMLFLGRGNIELGVDSALISFALVVALSAVLSFVPALQVSRGSPVETLREA